MSSTDVHSRPVPQSTHFLDTNINRVRMRRNRHGETRREHATNRVETCFSSLSSRTVPGRAERHERVGSEQRPTAERHRPGTRTVRTSFRYPYAKTQGKRDKKAKREERGLSKRDTVIGCCARWSPRSGLESGRKVLLGWRRDGH